MNLKSPIQRSNATPMRVATGLAHLWPGPAIRLTALMAALILIGPLATQAGEREATDPATIANATEPRAESSDALTPPSTSPKSDQDEGEEEGRNQPRIDGSADDMEVLQRLISMPPEQLARVRRLIEQLEAMDPEERETLHQRLHAFRQISPEERQNMREKWRQLSPEERREHIQRMRERRWNRVFEADESKAGDRKTSEKDND